MLTVVPGHPHLRDRELAALDALLLRVSAGQELLLNETKFLAMAYRQRLRSLVSCVKALIEVDIHTRCWRMWCLLRSGLAYGSTKANTAVEAIGAGLRQTLALALF